MTSSVYNYQNEAKIWLPMTSECHDPVNVRTLDVSGNNLHYRFGDGVTAGTFPSKLSGRRGYYFDASAMYLEALANQTNPITAGTWACFIRSYNNTLNYDIWTHFDGVGTCRALLGLSGGVLFYSGDLTNYALLNNVQVYPRMTGVLIAGTVSSGIRRVYAGGYWGTPNAAGVAVPGNPTTLPRIGARYNGAAKYPGEVLWSGHWEYALTDVQMRDLEARLRRELNDV